MTAISVRDLVKTYRVQDKKSAGLRSALVGLFHRQWRTIRAVDGISFSIEAGEMVAFLGPNGAGKTTTLKMLSGLIYPTSGQAEVLGFVPWERAIDYRRQFALVMGQKNQLWWDLPARESYRLHRDIYAIPEEQFTTVRDHLVDLLNVGKLLGQPVRELSLGERMKMELIAALLHSPRILYLDEPTIGLDVVAQTQLRDFLKQYNQMRNVTVLLTSHYMKDVESLCRRAIVINHGKLIYDGSLAGILSEFSHHKIVTLQFVEDAPAEIARYGEILERRGPLVRLRVARGEVAGMLGALLDRHAVADITVDEVPLEEVIAEVFESGRVPDPVDQVASEVSG